MKENEYLEQNNELIGENLSMKKIFKKRLNQKGLTLIELLAVIVILAIIAAIAVPAIGNIINNSRDKAVLAETSNILAGAKIAKNDNACGAAVSGVVTCEGSELNTFVEGLNLTDSTATPVADTNAKAVFTESTGAWEVTYEKLGKIKNATKFSVSGFTAGTDKTITDNELTQALEK